MSQRRPSTFIKVVIAIIPCVIWVIVCVGQVKNHTETLDTLTNAYASAGAPDVSLIPRTAGFRGLEEVSFEQYVAAHPGLASAPEEFIREQVTQHNEQVHRAAIYNAQYEMLVSLQNMWWRMMLIPLPAIFLTCWFLPIWTKNTEQVTHC